MASVVSILVLAKGAEPPDWPPFEGLVSMIVGVAAVLVPGLAIVLIRRLLGLE